MMVWIVDCFDLCLNLLFNFVGLIAVVDGLLVGVGFVTIVVLCLILLVVFFICWNLLFMLISIVALFVLLFGLIAFVCAGY